MERISETQDKPRRAVDFTDLSPADVVQFCQTINNLSQEQFDLQSETRDAFYHGLDYLAREDPELAAATFDALAESVDERVREAAAISIYTYVGYDKFQAFPIWNNLFHDAAPDVRDQATDSINWAIEAGSINPTEADLLRSLAVDQENSDDT